MRAGTLISTKQRLSTMQNSYTNKIVLVTGGTLLRNCPFYRLRYKRPLPQNTIDVPEARAKIRLSDGRDALPRDLRQDVRWSCPVYPPPTVDALRRVRRRTSGARPWTCCAGRAGTRIRSKALHQRLTIGRPAADRAGARPYLRRRSSGSVLLFLGLHTQKQSLPVSPFPIYR
jgi:hypothetical protein